MAQPFPANMCAADRNGSDLGCTANDLRVAQLTVNNGVASCRAGEPVTLDLSATLAANTTRFNIGVFLSRDGKVPTIRAASGGSKDCAVIGVPTSPPPFTNADGNACGDFLGPGSASVHFGTITVLCQANELGQLTIPTVVTWDQSAGTATSCQSPPSQWVQAGRAPSAMRGPRSRYRSSRSSAASRSPS